MLTSLVFILAGITAWCVASLALALIVGPLVRRRDRLATDPVVRRAQPVTGSIPLPMAMPH